MPNEPDPYGDFVITEEVTDYTSGDAGTERPATEGEIDQAGESRPGPAPGTAAGEYTADQLQPSAAPLSLRFRSPERGK